MSIENPGSGGGKKKSNHSWPSRYTSKDYLVEENSKLREAVALAELKKENSELKHQLATLTNILERQNQKEEV